MHYTCYFLRPVRILLVWLLFPAALLAQPKKGTNAPDILLPDQKGIPTSLSAQKGRLVLVEFWASWCGPCREKNPFLHRMYDTYHARGFTIYGISVDEDKSDWIQAIREDHIDWTQVIDETGAVATKWGVQYIPDAFLLEADGKVIDINSDEKKLAKLLRDYLK